MKTTFYIIAVTTLLFSCNLSTKGSWTDEDKAKVRTELESGKADFEASGVDFDAFVDCVTEKCEQNYSNFEEADSDIPGCEAIGIECLKSISGSSTSTIGNWSKEDLQKMDNAMAGIREEQGDSNPDLEEFIECYTQKAMANYPSFYDADSDVEGCTALSNECVNEIGIEF